MKQSERSKNKQLKREEDGTVTDVLSSARDITEQTKEYERLQQTEKRWLAITESTQDAILMMVESGERKDQEGSWKDRRKSQCTLEH